MTAIASLSTASAAAVIATALGCGLAAGAFFAFSTFVMPALGDLPPRDGVVAMQSINRAAPTPLFMLAIFGTGLACLGLVVWAVFAWEQPAARWVLPGAALYFAGSVVVTIAANIPLNNQLAATQAESAAGAELWTRYLRAWTAWNHVRTVASLGALALLIVALRVD